VNLFFNPFSLALRFLKSKGRFEKLVTDLWSTQENEKNHIWYIKVCSVLMNPGDRNCHRNRPVSPEKKKSPGWLSFLRNTCQHLVGLGFLNPSHQMNQKARFLNLIVGLNHVPHLIRFLADFVFLCWLARGLGLLAQNCYAHAHVFATQNNLHPPCL
jgi:hypothetical protein